MSDLIRREDVLRLAECGKLLSGFYGERAKDIIKAIPSAEPKVGKWEEIHIFSIAEATTIDMLQSTYCPICHRYHTTPYVYSYNHYDYCPNCGAKMERRTDETDNK